MNRRLTALSFSLLIAVGVGLTGSASVADAPLTDSQGRFLGEARVGNTLTSEGFFNTASDAACSEDINFQGSGSYTVPEAQLGRYVFANVIGVGRGDCVGPIGAVAPVVARSAVQIRRTFPVSDKIRTTSIVRIYATVTLDGKLAPARVAVDGYAKGQKVVSGVTNSEGRIKLTLPRTLPRGKATLKLVVPATAEITRSEAVLVVQVAAR